MTDQEFFYRLTPHVILEAANKAGFSTTGLCWQLNSLENRVYDLGLEDNSHVIAKFYRPLRWSKKQLEEEHEFLFDLADHEIPVCAPFRFPDGSSLKTIRNIYYAIWPRTGGRSFDEFDDEQLAVLGRLLARIHNIGEVKTGKNRLTCSAETLGENPLKFLLENKILPVECEKRYIKAVENICDIYNEHSQGVPYHRIHGDCHIGNILLGKEGFFFLDFDDFYSGPAVQDIWMLIPEGGSEGERKLNVMLEGYRMFREFDPNWLSLIEPLRALRFIHYAAWIARRWQDPAFTRTFPHFGTPDYWLQETNDLEDQLKMINSPSYAFFSSSGKNQAPPEEEEPELTNKDFFWDL